MPRLYCRGRGARYGPQPHRRNLLLAGITFAAALAMAGDHDSSGSARQQPAPAAGRPPNILVIWGDDIGIWNISHNNRGMMG